MKIDLHVLATVLIFVLVTSFQFGLYSQKTLGGNIEKFMLPAEMFGIPQELKDRGLEPLYTGENETGWDGQFYYYIANDILGIKDTIDHIDASSYRYQRIGLPLYTAIFSKVLGNDWVSPKTFLFSYFLLILAATVVGAITLKSFNVPPYLILVWSLSSGTQVTLFNALPDAAADAFFILSLPLLLAQRYWLASLPMIFAVLSREAYLLVPVFIALSIIFKEFKLSKDEPSRLTKFASSVLTNVSLYWLAIPVVCFLGWQVYLLNHFGVSPGSQAHNILGFPLVSWFNHLVSSITLDHPIWGSRKQAYAEAVALLIFAAILCITFYLSIWSLLFKKLTIPQRGIISGALAMVVLYTNFGPVVMMHYTGYYKAIGIFLILIPIFVSISNINQNYTKLIHLFLVGQLIATFIHNFEERINTPLRLDQYTQLSKIPVKNVENYQCLAKPSVTIEFGSVTTHNMNILGAIFNSSYISSKMKITNTSQHIYQSYHGAGSIFMSYHWLDENKNVVKDGQRTGILPTLMPGESTIVTIVSTLPNGAAELVPSLVQEGCFWFYQKDGAITYVPDHIKYN